jgi:DNA polymerase-1
MKNKASAKPDKAHVRKLMIWDGNNLFHRSAGNKGLMRLTHKGRPTGAIHGTVKSIISDIQTFKPDEVAVVFDGSGARVQKQKIYAGYKAQRSSNMDDALHHQMDVARDILRAAGICVLQKAGVDADDAIGALATLPNRSVLVVSNDKDFLQLVGSNCSTIRNRGNGPELWNTKRVREHYGIKPTQIADYLALCGDSIDGIPGLKGCGPVLAVKLLKRWGSLRAVVENRAKLQPRWKAAVTAQREDLRKFYKLTRLDTKVVSSRAMQNIVPRLVPGKYSADINALCEAHGLVWLNKWFQAHRPCVNTQSAGLWS